MTFRRWTYLASVFLFLTAQSVLGTPPILHWFWGPVMPLAKTCRATAVVRGEIVTVGGTSWEDVGPGRKIKRWTSGVYELNPQKLRWRELPNYPLLVGYAFAAAIGSQLYVVGGLSPSRGISEVYMLDLAFPRRHWAPAPPLPHARWGVVGAVIGNIIYVAGGVESDSSSPEDSHVARDVLAFDPSHPKKGWRQVAIIPGPLLEWRCGVGFGGKLYLFGGLSEEPREADKGFLPHTEAFVLDVSDKRWRKLPPLPIPLGSGAAATLDSRYILLAGGYALAVSANKTPDAKARTYLTSESLLYDTVESRYGFVTPLKMGVDDLGLVYTRGRIVALGGEDSTCRSRTDLIQIAVVH